MAYTALANGRVVTAVADSCPVDGTLLLRGGRIVGVFPSVAAAEAAAEQPVETIDVSGLTVLPGMFDCHVHLFFSGGMDMLADDFHDVDLAAQRAVSTLQAGVTTVRELGAPTPQVFQLRDDIAAGRRSGPRVLAAGPIVTTPDGHGHFVGEVVADGGRLPETMRKLAESGVDCVKIAVSGGVSTAGSDLFAVQFTEPHLRAGVDTAHELGLHVAAHASNPEAVRIAADVGIDSVEHAVMLDGAALDALAHSRTVLVPTLAATNRPPAFLDDPAVPEHIREKGRITVPAHRASIAKAVATGIGFACGTDAGSTATGHGLVAMEAEQLTACGLSNEDAVAAVTRESAGLLGLGDQLGTIEAGKLADVIAVAGDPTTDIGALADVRLVVQGGEIVHRVAA